MKQFHIWTNFRGSNGQVFITMFAERAELDGPKLVKLFTAGGEHVTLRVNSGVERIEEIKDETTTIA